MAPLRNILFNDHSKVKIEKIDPFLNESYQKFKNENNVDNDISDLVIDLNITHTKESASSKDFQLLKILGQGSFGKVFLVKKVGGSDDKKLYAMKVLKKATLKVRDRVRSKMERDILADIRHPFIVRLHYAFQTEGKLYLVLQFLKGGDLFTRLSKEIMFTEADVKFYLAELALALEHLHGLGIIYRDLKPENILLDVSGHLKLTDFGLSKESIFNDDRTFSFCGTVEYMAPEVVNRHGHGTAADWWSFAVLMFEMLTGTLPFHGKTRKDTMEMIMKAKLAMPTYLSEDAQSFLRCIFKRNPKNRLGYCGDGVIDLKKHEFFCDINWDNLYNLKNEPPFKPAINPADDAFCFDPEFTSKIPFNSPGVAISVSERTVFRGFSYVAPALQGATQKARPVTNVIPDGRILISDENLRTAKALGIKFKEFSSDYDLHELVGTGTFSKVYKCKHITSGKQYAVKVMDKAVNANPYEEIEIILRYSSHPNIVNVYDILEDNTSIYMVMEYLQGGELFDLITSKTTFTEYDVKEVIKCIVKTIAYLHKNRVVHRDVKPSNVLFLNSDLNLHELRIIDFGFARQMRADNGLLMTPCYTSNYVAPEVLTKQGHDSAADTWSIGIIMYTMLAGHSPFATLQTDSPEVIYERITKCKLAMEDGNWKVISNSAKNLLQKLLHCNPLKRISLDNVLKDAWMKIEKTDQININLNKNACEVMKDSVTATYKVLVDNKKTNLIPVNKAKLALRRNNNVVK
ncbi:hypothetical protein A3Q56_05017 [Intoshia linei]|uniref:Ribosomal protein S6 kinase n=1 Tax=Intoshia linei TaxID=1819745 RepID=A0A177AYZ1_9BILA|nr:hypothetical protein A3Q56_05017 [Intoshia linei]